MIKRRYDETTGELGKAYPESMTIPEPYLTLTEAENNKISADSENVYFYINNELTTKNKAQIEETNQKIASIKEQLSEIDLKSIRAIRSGETDYIAEYEAQAEALRNELAELE